MAVAAFAAPSAALADDTITVTSTADLVDTNPADGACLAANGKCTFRAALQTANMDPGTDHDTIVVPAGHFTLAPADPDPDGNDEHDADKAATGDWDITEPVTITGAGQGQTVLDGARLPNQAVLEISAPDGAATTPTGIELSGLTIEGGAKGAIENYDGITLRHVTLRDNIGASALDSGADDDVLVEDSDIVDNGRLDTAAEPNIASDGAGVEHNGTGRVTLRRVLVARNQGDTGGGIALWNGPMDIEDSSILDNVARDDRLPGNSEEAGGIVVAGGGEADGRLKVTGSTIAGNSADGDGGGILVWSYSQLEMSNSTISGNHSDGLTGALGVAGGNAKAHLRNVTIADNTSGSSQVEWYSGGRQAGDEITLQTTIVAGAGGGCAAPGLTSLGGNLDAGTTCGFTATGDLQGVDPKLGPLADNGGATATRLPAGTSPAVDAGVPCLATDQRGVGRPAGGSCDIGATELAKEPSEPTHESPDPTPDPTHGETATPAPTGLIGASSPKPAQPAGTPSFDRLVELPSTRSCVSRRAFRIRLRVPKGMTATKAVVLVNGKVVKTVRGKRLTAPVDLRGLPRGRFSVTIKLTLGDGRTVSGTRRYRTCTPKDRTPHRAPKV